VPPAPSKIVERPPCFSASHGDQEDLAGAAAFRLFSPMSCEAKKQRKLSVGRPIAAINLRTAAVIWRAAPPELPLE